MKYIVYITTNVVNNKVYVGVHKTTTPEVFDGYLGCGTRVNSYKSKKDTAFQKAVNKYGPNKFTRHTLFVFDTVEEANHIERVVTLSPLTPMATHFHIRNGAKQILINKETQNFEYKLTEKKV